ncbi:hypothetical protein [Actinotalea subterranea]|uniref:hypothetical protein n=1 Tax=Actinotalea subterranea TaxID=2607497 RepID=UPI0011EF3EB0|nr:hypothetical protein [Actinotalea subterranea]
MRRTTSRAGRTVLLTVAMGSLALLACTAASPHGDQAAALAVEPQAEATTAPATPPPVQRPDVVLPDAPATVLAGADASARAVEMSTTLYESAPVAVLAPADDATAQLLGARTAVALGVPLLLTPAPTPAATPAPPVDTAPTPEPAETAAPTEHDPAEVRASATAAELDRLGAQAVLAVAGSEDWATAWADDADDDTRVVAPLPRSESAVERLIGVPLPTSPDASAGQEVAAVATLERPDVSDASDEGAASDPTPRATDLPSTRPADPLDDALVLTTGDPLDLAALATARAAGADVVTAPGGDPRSTSATVQAFADAKPHAVIGLGSAVGSAERLATRAATAATGVELPGGGQVLFPGRRLVALYGTPHFAGLGLLGEQDLPATIARAQGQAAAYQPLTSDTVVPTLELIVTVASAEAGPDGNYSNELPVESFIPWVEAARDAGQYVVIDLQPGRTDFVTQAKAYEALLLYPNVGLALDPEWRLAPDQVHLRQIGSVHADEINAVSAYLAELTRTHALPQKLLVLHQFTNRMITARETVDTSHDELHVLIHADGQGSQGAKAGTWASLHQGAPAGVAWGWKNFVDEDVPMLTPEQTYQVQPLPELVTYQ